MNANKEFFKSLVIQTLKRIDKMCIFDTMFFEFNNSSIKIITYYKYKITRIWLSDDIILQEKDKNFENTLLEIFKKINYDFISEMQLSNVEKNRILNVCCPFCDSLILVKNFKNNFSIKYDRDSMLGYVRTILDCAVCGNKIYIPVYEYSEIIELR